ncbi:MAG TPA: HEPN domain-containing protein, partial [Candidatus Methylomirabilis sp.]|nr:HEPN domain-containing protein [Candidatus Methylomirabilis sp.]
VVEKYLKALLTAQGIAFPNTHNIRKLVEILSAGAQLNLSQDEQDVSLRLACVTRANPNC